MKILNFLIHPYYPVLSLSNRTIINTLNPHSYCVAKKDEEFQKALHASDILIPDGVGIVWAVRFLKGEKINKIAGADMHSHLLDQAQERGLSVFYMGASEQTLKRIEQRIQKEYSGIKVGNYSPPYKASFSDNDSEKMIKRINDFSPDILFVGMTAPKQEKWVYKNKEYIDAKIICSIGAVFDFYAGTLKRPSKFWINLGLEWFPRFLKEPKRLWKRNFISTPVFLWDVFIEKLSS